MMWFIQAAWATTVPARTISEMLEPGAVAVEADIVGVRYDYVLWERHEWPVTLLDLSVVSISGAALMEPVALLLPGGPEIDGAGCRFQALLTCLWASACSCWARSMVTGFCASRRSFDRCSGVAPMTTRRCRAPESPSSRPSAAECPS